MRRIALITDGQGWIVDRISRIYQHYVPGIEVFYPSVLSVEGLSHIIRNFDLVHFNNFFVEGLQPFFSIAPIPTIVSIRSFRFSNTITSMTPSLFHVIHPDMAQVFQPSVFISDGIDLDRFRPDRKFRVGMACHDTYTAFKGLDLLLEAASGLDMEIVHVSSLPHDEMKKFYQSIDLYVCASESEGFSAPVVECMALNIPVMSTRTGVASYLPGIQVVGRTVAEIREGLLAHMTRHRVIDLAWPSICMKISDMYQTLLDGDAKNPPQENPTSLPHQKVQTAECELVNYTLVIDRNINKMNDDIFDALKPKISGRWLDVGCNVGVMLDEVPNGTGVDASETMVAEALRRGRDVRLANACNLPFLDKQFDTVVLSCVLEQIPDWRRALDEAKRVGHKVIGINPIPGSQWGKIQGAVKSIIPPDEMGGEITYPPIDGKYLFEINCIQE